MFFFVEKPRVILKITPNVFEGPSQSRGPDLSVGGVTYITGNKQVCEWRNACFHFAAVTSDSVPFCPWIKFSHGSRGRFCPLQTSSSHQGLILEPGPAGRMRWHHMAECCVPCWCAGTAHMRASRRQSTQPTPFLMGPSGSGCHGDVWLLCGDEKKGGVTGN